MPPRTPASNRIPAYLPKTATLAVPAPTGGWNARDSLDSMDPTDAISLVNLFPTFGQVQRRNGWGIYATGLGGAVQTLSEFNAASVRKLLAAANGSIFDVSSPGDVTVVTADFTGSIAPNTATVTISTTTMTVSAIGSGTVLAAGQVVVGSGITLGTFIVQQLTGTAGNTGTYQVSASQTVGSPTSVTMSGGGLTVSDVASGNISLGYVVAGTGVTANQNILAFGTGDGNTGTYAVSLSQTLSSTVGLTQTSMLAAGFSSNQWQTAMFQNAADIASMIFVNGTDAPQQYTGGIMQPATISGTTTGGTALNPINLIGCTPYQGRVFYWEKQSQVLWYTALGAIAGVLTPFDLGELSGFGGNIQNICSWTISGGNGPNDYCVIMMNSGDVLMYSGTANGTDISDATKWALVGIFHIGSPVGNRCSAKLGPDVAVINKNGFVPLSQVMPGLWNPQEALSNKITGAATAAVLQYGSNFGWEILLYPLGNQCIFNVPLSGSISQQYVLNTATGSWCQFTNMNAQCWSLYKDDPYFGDPNGNVCLYSGSTKVTLPGATSIAGTLRSDSGSAIACSAQTAWNYLGDRNRLKRLALLRPAFSSDNAGLLIGFAVGTDFAISAAQPAVTIFTGNGTPWGSPWGSPWAPGTQTFTPRVIATGVGNAFSTYAAANVTNIDLNWYSLTYQYEPGLGV